TFSNNSAGISGGAIEEASTTFTVTDCTFVGNQATGSTVLNFGAGGAIAWTSGATINRCTFSNNSALLEGGALWDDEGSGANSTISDCTLTGNSLTSNSPNTEFGLSNGGGAIWLSFDAPNAVTIASCTIAGNHVEPNGLGSGIYLSPTNVGTL